MFQEIAQKFPKNNLKSWRTHSKRTQKSLKNFLCIKQNFQKELLKDFANNSKCFKISQEKLQKSQKLLKKLLEHNQSVPRNY